MRDTEHTECRQEFIKFISEKYLRWDSDNRLVCLLLAKDYDR